MPLGVSIPENEVRRYMGFRGPVKASPETDAMVKKAVISLEKDCSPKYVAKEFPVSIEGTSVHIADITIESRALSRNLMGCTCCILFAATAGPACDMLVKRAAVTSSAYSSCCQAAGAAAIEAYCDFINEKIKNEYETKGLYARPRFSPGYGDLSLSHQKDWFRLLDITKNTGIELTDSLLMVPTKSVTAVIGLSPDKLPCIKQGCESCTMSATCAFSRKE
ncbi:MAG: Vitamin B12 dependent methionine synthase activation subunit [Clostridiales bacterium]|nr:Vitamin B12 dependent methionine synthase activation subunit [Clostridiales bacterium]MBR6488246.1 Vitamin B12 dependent methionine synthase activation subunit [Clostridiales bacterium]